MILLASLASGAVAVLAIIVGIYIIKAGVHLSAYDMFEEFVSITSFTGGP